MHWIKDKIRKSVEISSERKKQKQFGFLVSGFLLLLLVKSFSKEGFLIDFKQILVIISLMVAISITFLKVNLLRPILFFWMFLGQILGEIMSFIVFAITYYVFLTPIVSFTKLFEKKTENKGWIDKQNRIDYTKLH